MAVGSREGATRGGLLPGSGSSGGGPRRTGSPRRLSPLVERPRCPRSVAAGTLRRDGQVRSSTRSGEGSAPEESPGQEKVHGPGQSKNPCLGEKK